MNILAAEKTHLVCIGTMSQDDSEGTYAEINNVIGNRKPVPLPPCDTHVPKVSGKARPASKRKMVKKSEASGRKSSEHFLEVNSTSSKTVIKDQQTSEANAK